MVILTLDFHPDKMNLHEVFLPVYIMDFWFISGLNVKPISLRNRAFIIFSSFLLCSKENILSISSMNTSSRAYIFSETW